MGQTCKFTNLHEAKVVIDKVREFNGLYEIIANIEDKEKQSQTVNIILGVDTNPLDINSLYGWNQHVKRGNIKRLISEGIVPNENSLQKYQKEVNMEVYELSKDLKLSPVQIVYSAKNKNEIKRSLVY